MMRETTCVFRSSLVPFTCLRLCSLWQCFLCYAFLTLPLENKHLCLSLKGTLSAMESGAELRVPAAQSAEMCCLGSLVQAMAASAWALPQILSAPLCLEERFQLQWTVNFVISRAAGRNASRKLETSSSSAEPPYRSMWVI